MVTWRCAIRGPQPPVGTGAGRAQKPSRVNAVELGSDVAPSARKRAQKRATKGSMGPDDGAAE